jgi:hypothetical protein
MYNVDTNIPITGIFPSYYCYYYYYYHQTSSSLINYRVNWHSSATLTEVFLCFFLSCKANARVYLAKTGHGPHSS